MKRMNNIEKDFTDVEVYDIGVKDIFGNKFYVAINTITNHIRFISKNADYEKRRKKLDKLKLNYVQVEKYGNVIDVLGSTYDYIFKIFPEAILPVKENLNLW